MPSSALSERLDAQLRAQEASLKVQRLLERHGIAITNVFAGPEELRRRRSNEAVGS